MKPLCLDSLETPLGEIWLFATGRGVRSVRFVTRRERTLAEIPPSRKGRELVWGGLILNSATRQLQEYLSETRTTFTVRLDLAGFSVWERSVIRAVRGIPYGETMTYAQLASAVGTPRRTRRVLDFLRKNPLAILVPCHRVVGADGPGYHVGGRRIKRWLIEMEQGQMRLALEG
ncbi:MAG: methylated-DNA--[protein]-cysteine S-methyltransferase [Candidatus Eisenbacteria sp.]|nr:methylated-DNA--[protein]-cysteine S-methyltransferase [Candidatus Eisenbacteria bacterium]